MAMNNGFSPAAQEALRLAHEIVQQKRHTQMDVEHILLALLKPRQGTVWRIIEQIGGDPQLLAQHVDRMLNNSPDFYAGQGSLGTTNMHITMQAQRAVSEAANEAMAMDDKYIGVEHLFLALAGPHSGTVGQLLNTMHIDRARIRQALQEIPGAPEMTVTPLDVTKPYQRLLGRVIRLQHELAELQRDLVALIEQDESSELFK